jgi:hypothetical protein
MPLSVRSKSNWLTACWFAFVVPLGVWAVESQRQLPIVLMVALLMVVGVGHRRLRCAWCGYRVMRRSLTSMLPKVCPRCGQSTHNRPN